MILYSEYNKKAISLTKMFFPIFKSFKHLKIAQILIFRYILLLIKCRNLKTSVFMKTSLWPKKFHNFTNVKKLLFFHLLF